MSKIPLVSGDVYKRQGKNILIDCGMEQGPDTYKNRDIPVSPADTDCIFLTHAHRDHSGKLPYLTANGYKGPIYATASTAKLCKICLLYTSG